jgi:four helix bundle protein
MPSFEDLDVWKRSVDLSVALYREMKESKDFGFRDQITRAGLSIPSNIAEGMERSSSRDQIKFLEYSRASCAEVRTQVIVGQKAGFIADPIAAAWVQETRELAAILQGLIRAIRNRPQPPPNRP